ncbi:hypothetical protein GCM10008956_22190 [Deinococcus arenae]|uniref:Uncharacterized protein n=1 Tax=Deinococcus arenae TaxID=1452751 RepID=A0A8H9GVP8_9DEIO|nr:hypothetical protein GCM10008956_22190 [Deinococcus arenae]
MQVFQAEGAADLQGNGRQEVQPGAHGGITFRGAGVGMGGRPGLLPSVQDHVKHMGWGCTFREEGTPGGAALPYGGAVKVSA